MGLGATLVFVRSNGEWRVAHFHQTVAPAKPPAARPTLAQMGLFIYPAKGQTPDQTAFTGWAETQTGLTASTGTVNTDAAAQAAQAGAQQATQANQQAIETFKKAAGACLEGRGYTVK